MKQINRIIVMASLLILALAGLAWAQTEEVPAIFSVIFNNAIIQAAVIVVGVTKLVRNAMGNVKGVYAFIAAVIVSFGYALIKFWASHGILYALLIGAVASAIATSSFWLTKKIGGEVNINAG